jgi:hypothetical protein
MKFGRLHRVEKAETEMSELSLVGILGHRTYNLSGIGSRSGTPAAAAPSSRSTGRRRSTNAPSATAGVHAGLAALGRPREAGPLGPPLSLAVHN